MVLFVRFRVCISCSTHLCKLHVPVSGAMCFLSVFIRDGDSGVTLQMVHVSCQLSDGTPLSSARRKYVSRSWEALQHAAVSSSTQSRLRLGFGRFMFSRKL